MWGKQLAIQLLWATARLLVICVSLIFLGVEFFFLFWCTWTKLGLWVNLRFYFFVSGVDQVEWGREVSPKCPFVTSEFWELFLRLRPTASEVTYCSVCGVFVDYWAYGGWFFVLLGGWCYSCDGWVYKTLPISGWT